MSKRLRTIFPAVALVISVPLLIWDLYNEGVIAAMGMGWDTGPPVWPYQTPMILFFSLNFPAYFVSIPVANAFGLIVPMHYLVVFPATVLWWWLFGLTLDNGANTRRFPLVFPIVLAGALLWMALTDSYRQSFGYGSHHTGVETTLLILRSLAPILWALLLALFTARAAMQAARTK
jgi:hypothetical protein